MSARDSIVFKVYLMIWGVRSGKRVTEIETFEEKEDDIVVSKEK